MKKRILVVNDFPLYPPRFGGQFRIYNLYRHLSQWFDITYLCFGDEDKITEMELCPNFREIRVPKGKLHREINKLLEKIFKKTLNDIVAMFCVQFNNDFNNKLKILADSSFCLISTHMYLYRTIKDYNNLKVYEALSVEYFNKIDIFKSFPGKIISFFIKRTEKLACNDSDIIFTVSDDDKSKMSEFYGVLFDKIILLPNGTDTLDIVPAEENEKTEAKKYLNLINEKILLFIGSAHPPNVVAAKIIIDNIAPLLPEFKFLIVGDVAGYMSTQIPTNVKILGYVSDETRKIIFKSADLALNPMTYGSGTNLKMLDYMAAGLPIVTTSIGARGLNIINDEQAVVCEIIDFKKNILRLFEDEVMYKKLGENGRKLVEQEYSWIRIADKMQEEIEIGYENKKFSNQ